MKCGQECKDLLSDQQNCGTCGNACGAGQSCQAGKCQCSAGLIACGGGCVPSDATNCGGCGTTCPGGQVCSSNSCQGSCGAGETQCSGGACVDTTNNAFNCGGCGTQCPAGSVCNGGVCGCSASGQMLCGSACVDVMSDGDHCGGCNHPCTGTCSNGTCMAMPGGTVLLPPGIRRMTNAEYDASVKALLNTALTPSTTFPPDSRHGAGYTLNDAQRVDPVMAKALDDAALALVAEARTGNPSKLSMLAPCMANPTAAQGETCAMTFITDFGGKAFRRAVATSEATDLMALYRAGAASPGTYNEGIDLVTRGILQSAGFLYVTSLGAAGVSGTVTLTPQELASNLSYLVAGGPPDSTLMTAADLGTPDGRETQVRRLLGLQTGRDRMVRVVREWLGVDRIVDTAKDTTVYGMFTPAVRTSMDTETKKFIDEVVQRSTGTVGELMSANWSIVDTTLAGIYGATSAGATAHTNLPKRFGILNQAAFLSVFAHAHESAPVLRGVAVMRRVACMKLPDPQSLNIQVVPPVPDPAKSTRDRFDIHATDAACATCHNTIDNIGFAFELFDGMGKERPVGSKPNTLRDTHLGTTGTVNTDTTSNTTIAPSSDFPSDFAGTYADSNALATALGNSAQVRECMARQLFRSSSGKSDDSVLNAEQSFVSMWKQMPSDRQGKFVEVLVAYVRSPLFDQRSAP
jgi:uncharacterized protein DUF1592/uncharacterized protein DUF1588/uncharacterized protein DUF1595/uncharacterized protein DUF1587